MPAHRSVSAFTLVAAIAASAFSVGGCASRVARANMQVARYAAPQLVCPESQVTVTSVGGDRWQAEGCGRRGVFVCAAGLGLGRGYGRWGGGYGAYTGYRGGYAGNGCQLSSPLVTTNGAPTQNGYPPSTQAAVQPGYGLQAPPPSTYGSTPTQPTAAVNAQAWSDEVGLTIFAQLQAPVLACVPGSGSLVLNLEIQLDGHVARVEGMEALSADQQACVTDAVDAVAVPGGLSQAVRVPFTFR